MTPVSRKVIAWVVTAVGIAVVVYLGWTFGRSFMEQWYLWKLERDDSDQRQRAAEQLAAMKSARAVPRLVEILCEVASRQPDLRAAADLAFSHYSATALVNIGPPSIPHLVEALTNEDPKTNAAVRYTLQCMGAATTEEVLALTTLLEHGSSAVRSGAIRAFRYIRPSADEAIPALVARLEDEDKEVRLDRHARIDWLKVNGSFYN